jgi:hypothetical protein
MTMSHSDSDLTPEQKKNKDRAIWTIYAVMVVLILLPMGIFLAKHVL